MTHPLDKVYRFSTAQHWGRGHARNFLFGDGPRGGLVAPGLLEARTVARGDAGSKHDPVTITALAADPCGDVLWLQSDGRLHRLHEGRSFLVARLPASAGRLIWGQLAGWLAGGGTLLRIDTRDGARTGSFAAPGWRVVDAVQDRCDGVIAVESRDATMRLRRLRADGRSRVLATVDGLPEPLAALRWQTEDRVHLVLVDSGVLRVAVLAMDGSIVSDTPYPGLDPAGPAAMEAPGRLVLAHRDAGVFAIAHGLAEPVRRIASADPVPAFAALVSARGTLYAAAGRRLLALSEAPGAAGAETSVYYSPVLQSPPGDRSGWLRADIRADLPRGARVRVASRGLADLAAADAYAKALHSDPGGVLESGNWPEESASNHFGDGERGALRHYLGHETAEFLALRIELSTPAGAGPAAITGMDVLYPNRSLIDDLPAIYRNGTSSEAQFRRMLAPFQALVDEIDDRIGEGARRADPAHADDLWSGFLLSWLGHGDLASLPSDRRRALLRALPEALRRRGTLAGLTRVMDCLVPDGYAIEDGGLAPDVWVLSAAGDPAGARLGRETAAGVHRPLALALGACTTPLGGAVLKEACLDPGRLSVCSADVIVRVFGGPAIRDLLEPFAARIARSFAPANTRLRFVFGDHDPPQLLERARPAVPGDDPEALFTLDDHRSRALGAWRLPRAGSAAPDSPAVLDEAHLDGTLTLA